MYYKLNDKEVEIMEEVSKITVTDYELNNNFISDDNLFSALEDLLSWYKHEKEEAIAKEQESEDYDAYMADIRHDEMMLGD